MKLIILLLPLFMFGQIEKDKQLHFLGGALMHGKCIAKEFEKLYYYDS